MKTATSLMLTEDERELVEKGLSLVERLYPGHKRDVDALAKRICGEERFEQLRKLGIESMQLYCEAAIETAVEVLDAKGAGERPGLAVGLVRAFREACENH